MKQFSATVDCPTNKYVISKPKKNVFETIWKILFVLLLFQTAIANIFRGTVLESLFNYLDEITYIALFLVLLYNMCVKRVKFLTIESIILFIYILFLSIGIISTLIYHIQPWMSAIVDMIACSKFIVGYFSIRSICIRNDFESSELLHSLNKIARFCAILFFVLTLHELIFSPWFEKGDYRYFTFAIQLFYPHPTWLALSSITLISVLSINLKNTSSNIYFILMLSFVTAMTLRMKALVFVAIFFIMYLFTVKIRLKNKVFLLCVCGILGVFLAWDQIQIYFFGASDFSPRSLLLQGGKSIADYYFPLGSGFGTYGNQASIMNYSPLYTKLGFNSIWGMSSSTDSFFLQDSFWPVIMAQFGYFGVVLFSVILVLFFVLIFKIQPINLYMYITALSLMVYLLIASTSETAFFNPISLLLFMLLGIAIDQCDQRTLSVPKKKISKYIR